MSAELERARRGLRAAREFFDHPPLHSQSSRIGRDFIRNELIPDALRALDSLEEQLEAREKALDRIERLLGNVALDFLKYDDRRNVNTAWACAREHTEDPKLIPKSSLLIPCGDSIPASGRDHE